MTAMKAEYDLSKMKSRRNPYASKLKKPVTMRLSEDVVAYFKNMAADAGVLAALGAREFVDPWGTKIRVEDKA